ncbi:S1 family peptidase [Streptomyces sp. NPDC054933]
MYERDGSTSKTVGRGTGFVIRGDLFGTRHQGYLVTNRHVLDPDFKKLSGRRIESVTVAGYHQGQRLWAEPDIIRFTIEHPVVVFPDDSADGDRFDVALINLDTANLAQGLVSAPRFPTPRLADYRAFQSANVTVGTQVLMPGYPGIDQSVADRPILVAGTIASDPRSDAAIGRETFAEGVLCHSFSWEGMSGSPVFALPRKDMTWADVERGDNKSLAIVGINAGHVRIGGSAEGALTHFVKSTVLIGLLRKAGARGLGLHLPPTASDRPALQDEEVELAEPE